jgi:hypothetical protein
LQPGAAAPSIATRLQENAMPRTDRLQHAERPSLAVSRSALTVVIVGLAVFGAALVLLPGPTTRLFSWIAYGSAGRVAAFGPEAVAYVQLVHAILGAITVGWALTLLGVVAWLWHGDPDRAWLAVAAPAAVWFVLDTGYSLASGFWRNAVFNALVALALAVPLLLLCRARSRSERGTHGARTTPSVSKPAR